MSSSYEYGAARSANYYVAQTATAVEELRLPADADFEGAAVLLLSNESGDGLIVSGTHDEIVDYLTYALNHAIARRAAALADFTADELPVELVEARRDALTARNAHRKEVV